MPSTFSSFQKRILNSDWSRDHTPPQIPVVSMLGPLQGHTSCVVIPSNYPRLLVLKPYSANQNSGFHAIQKLMKSRLAPWWEKCDLDPIKRCHILRVVLWESTYLQLYNDVNIIWAQNKKFCTINKRNKRMNILFWGIFSGLKFTNLSK